jgi:ParB family chromosome partitioning protein
MHIPQPTVRKSPLISLLGQQDQSGKLLDIPVTRIVRNEKQPRTDFDQDRLTQLTESIRESGVIQPIAVRPRSDGNYEIIAGERRWLSAQAAGLTTVPAVVRGADDKESLILALAENIVRADLNALELARAYAALIDEHNLNVSELARALGRSRPSVANTLRLLDLPDDVLELVQRGELGEGHARAILSIEDRSAQRRAARMAVASGMSVRELEAHSRRANAGPAGRARKATESPLSSEIVEAIAQQFPGGAITAKRTAKGASLEIRFPTDAQLVDAALRMAGLEV